MASDLSICAVWVALSAFVSRGAVYNKQKSTLSADMAALKKKQAETLKAILDEHAARMAQLKEVIDAGSVEQTKLMELAETAREAHKLALEAMKEAHTATLAEMEERLTSECDQLIESATNQHSNTIESLSQTRNDIQTACNQAAQDAEDAQAECTRKMIERAEAIESLFDDMAEASEDLTMLTDQYNEASSTIGGLEYVLENDGQMLLSMRSAIESNDLRLSNYIQLTNDFLNYNEQHVSPYCEQSKMYMKQSTKGGRTGPINNPGGLESETHLNLMALTCLSREDPLMNWDIYTMNKLHKNNDWYARISAMNNPNPIDQLREVRDRAMERVMRQNNESEQTPEESSQEEEAFFAFIRDLLFTDSGLEDTYRAEKMNGLGDSGVNYYQDILNYFDSVDPCDADAVSKAKHRLIRITPLIFFLVYKDWNGNADDFDSSLIDRVVYEPNHFFEDFPFNLEGGMDNPIANIIMSPYDHRPRGEMSKTLNVDSQKITSFLNNAWKYKANPNDSELSNLLPPEDMVRLTGFMAGCDR